MAQFCTTRRAIWPCIIMLLLGCFCLFVAFGAVDLTPQRQRQSQVDQTKEILLVNVVRSKKKNLSSKIQFNSCSFFSSPNLL